MSKVKLKDLGEFKNGLNFDSSKSVAGCKIIGVTNFKDNYIADLTNLNEVDNSIVTEECLLADGDILFVRSNGNKALVGRTMLIENLNDRISFSGFCIRFRPNAENIHSPYLLYLLKSPSIRKLFSSTQQTNINNLNQSVLGDIQIELIPKVDQIKTSNLIHDITRKIQNNNKIIKELEDMAKTLYDYWFVQFDFPDENGKPYKSSGGKMVYNEKLKREIPQGWEECSISSKMNIYQSETISNSLFNDSYEYCVYGGGGLIGKYENYNHAKKEVIVSCRGSCGNVYMTMPNSWITGNAMVVSPVDTDVSKNYLYFFLKTYGVDKYITGSVQKQITRENLSQMTLLIPPMKTLEQFEKIINPVFNKSEKITLENQQLNSLRDWLLPMLMNGQAVVE